MRRGQAVQIKMSSATARNGSMTSRLFDSLTANVSKLSWQQLQKSCLRNSWMFRGQSTSSCLRNACVNDQLTIIGQVARGMTGQGQIDERRYLKHSTLPERWPAKPAKH